MGQSFPVATGHPSPRPPFVPKFESLSHRDHREHVAHGVEGRPRLGAFSEKAASIPQGKLRLEEMADLDTDIEGTFGVHTSRVKFAESALLHGFKQVTLEVNNRLQFSVKTLQNLSHAATQLNESLSQQLPKDFATSQSKEDRQDWVRKLTVLLLQIYCERLTLLVEQYARLDNLYGWDDDDDDEIDVDEETKTSNSTKTSRSLPKAFPTLPKLMFNTMPQESWDKLQEICQWVGQQLAQVGWHVTPAVRPILTSDDLLTPPNSASSLLHPTYVPDDTSKLWDKLLWNLSLPNFMANLKSEVYGDVHAHIANIRSHLLHTTTSLHSTQVFCYSALSCLRTDMRAIRRYSLENPDRYSASIPISSKESVGGEHHDEDSLSSSSEGTRPLQRPKNLTPSQTPLATIDPTSKWSSENRRSIDFEFTCTGPLPPQKGGEDEDDQDLEFVPKVDFNGDAESSESLDLHDETTLKLLSRLPTMDKAEEDYVLGKVSKLNRPHLLVASANAAAILRPCQVEKRRERSIEPTTEELNDGSRRVRKSMDFIWNEVRVCLNNGLDEICRMERKLVQWKAPKSLLYIASCYELATLTLDPKDYSPPQMNSWPTGCSRLAGPLIHKYILSSLVILDAQFKKINACVGLLREDLFAMTSDVKAEQRIREFVSKHHLWQLVGGHLPLDPTHAFVQIVTSITGLICSIVSVDLSSLYQAIVHLLDTGDLPTPCHFVRLTESLAECIDREAHRLNGINQTWNSDYAAFESELLSGFSPHIPPERFGEYLRIRQSLKLAKLPTLAQKKAQEEAEERMKEEEWRHAPNCGSLSSEEDEEDEMLLADLHPPTRESFTESGLPLGALSSSTSSSTRYSGSTKIEGSWIPTEQGLLSPRTSTRMARNINPSTGASLTDNKSAPLSTSQMRPSELAPPPMVRRQESAPTLTTTTTTTTGAAGLPSSPSIPPAAKPPPSATSSPPPSIKIRTNQKALGKSAIKLDLLTEASESSGPSTSRATPIPAIAASFPSGEGNSSEAESVSASLSGASLSYHTAKSSHSLDQTSSSSVADKKKKKKKKTQKTKKDKDKYKDKEKEKDKPDKKSLTSLFRSHHRHHHHRGESNTAKPSPSIVITSFDSRTYFQNSSASSSTQSKPPTPMPGHGEGATVPTTSTATTTTSTPSMDTATPTSKESSSRSSRAGTPKPGVGSVSSKSASTASKSSKRTSSHTDTFYPPADESDSMEEDLPGEVGAVDPSLQAPTSRVPVRSRSFSSQSLYRQHSYSECSKRPRAPSSTHFNTLPARRAPTRDVSLPSVRNPTSTFAFMTANSTAEATALAHSIPSAYATASFSSVTDLEVANAQYIRRESGTPTEGGQQQLPVVPPTAPVSAATAVAKPKIKMENFARSGTPPVSFDTPPGNPIPPRRKKSTASSSGSSSRSKKRAPMKDS